MKLTYNMQNSEKKPTYNEIQKVIFRNFCEQNLELIRKVPLPAIPKDSKYETVYVECRDFAHNEFIIRNAIYRLGPEWSHTIVCGKNNHASIKKFCDAISENIKILVLNTENMTVMQYSNLLKTEKFWNYFKGEKILIHQEDSFIYRNGIEKFLKYDYIGAPFQHPFKVGNGGFSLRTRQVMIDCIKKNDQRFVHLVEDLFFSGTMQFNSIGLLADLEAAGEFSLESIYHQNTFAAHDPWYGDRNWLETVKKSVNEFSLIK